MEAITTREAAEVLGARHDDALHLLKAARIPHRRIGTKMKVSQYLWDAEAVRRFQRLLETDVREGGRSDDH